jgi:hypothetical protein
MNMTPLSTVIGVFPGHNQANSAIDELRHAQFSYDRIRLVERGTGSFMDSLKGMFTGQASVASTSSDSLVKMGMPDHDAQYYQRELDENHVLLLMNADDRPQDAFDIMRQNGAFDINARLRTTPAENVEEAHDFAKSQAATSAPPVANPTYSNRSQVDPNAAPVETPVYANGSQADSAETPVYTKGSQVDPNTDPVVNASYPNIPNPNGNTFDPNTSPATSRNS